MFVSIGSSLPEEKLCANVSVAGDAKVSRLFAGNQKRLVELKKRYDADNCFKTWHNLMDMAILPGDYAGDM
jgi:hypothetical protein